MARYDATQYDAMQQDAMQQDAMRYLAATESHARKRPERGGLPETAAARESPDDARR